MGSVACVQVNIMLFLECLRIYIVYLTTGMTHRQSGCTNEQRTVCAGEFVFSTKTVMKKNVMGSVMYVKNTIKCIL